MPDQPHSEFDFWYAVHNTRVIRPPTSTLETFGATMLNYHLVTQLMDSVEQIRVREGRIEAFRPTIITPQSFAETLLEGFGDSARTYADWLREHEQNLRILRYGFGVRKQELIEETVTGSLEEVAARVKSRVDEKDDPLGAVVIGVDKPWEVCLLKLMVDVVEKSASSNLRDMSRRPGGLQPDDPKAALHAEIERDFEVAARDRTRINALGDKLKRYDVFDQYEDRFFALVRRGSG